MATLSRPPLTYSPQQKRWIGQVDPIVRPLTLGIPAAPLALPLNALRADWSAPSRKQWIGQVDPIVRPLTLGIPSNPAFALPLSASIIEWSAPQRKKQIQVDVYPNPISILVDQVNSPSFVEYPSAPQRLFAPKVDAYPNLSVTTLGQLPVFALPLSAVKLNQSAPLKVSIRSPDIFPNLIQTTLVGLTTFAAPLSSEILDDSSPRAKRISSSDDYPNLLANTLQPTAIPLPLSAQRIDWSAPQIKKPSGTVDQPVIRSITLNPVPMFLRMDQSAPPPKKPAQDFVHLNYRALIAPLPPWDLPLRHGDDFSAYQRKYSIKSDVYPNIVATISAIPSYTEDIRVIVPYLIGSTAAHATQQLASVHLLVATIGITGTVTAQDVAAFTLVARGTTVAITLGGTANNPPRGGSRGGGLPDYTLPN